MANDRLCIACQFCGERLYLYAYCQSRGYVIDRDVPKLPEFFQKHIWECHPRGSEYEYDLGMESGFEVMTWGREEQFDKARIDAMHHPECVCDSCAP